MKPYRSLVFVGLGHLTGGHQHTSEKLGVELCGAAHLRLGEHKWEDDGHIEGLGHLYRSSNRILQLFDSLFGGLVAHCSSQSVVGIGLTYCLGKYT